jgi:hypothetical protein
MARKGYRHIIVFKNSAVHNRSQWPRNVRHVSAAAGLLGLRIRILPRAWMRDFCECCVLSGRGQWVGLIARPEESYWLWCVLGEREASIMKTPGQLGNIVQWKRKRTVYRRMWFTLSWNRYLKMKGKKFPGIISLNSCTIPVCSWNNRDRKLGNQ